LSSRASAAVGPVGAAVEATANSSSAPDRGTANEPADGVGDLPQRSQFTMRTDIRLSLGDDTTLRGYGAAAVARATTTTQSTTQLTDSNHNGQLEVGARLEHDFGNDRDVFVELRASRFQHLFAKTAGEASALKTDATQSEVRAESRLTGVMASSLPWLEELSGAVGVVAVAESVRRVDGDGNNGIPGAGGRLLPALYAEMLWMPMTWLSLAPGLRADVVVDGTGVGGALSPKLGIKVLLPASLSWRTSYGMGFRVPTFEERFLFFDHSELGYVVEGNADLQPERSHGLRTSLTFAEKFRLLGPTDNADGNFDTAMEASVHGFVNLLEQLIAERALSRTTEAGIPVFSYVNADRALTAGVDAHLSLQLPWRIAIDLGYQWLALATDTSSCPPNNPWLCPAADGARTLPLRPSHSFRANGSWVIPVTETVLFLRANAIDARVVDSTTAAAGYLDIGVGLTQELFEHTELLVAADNLLDAYDSTFGPKPGRSARVSVRAFF
jgi:outer membrane receptor protein involved in Fe transport